MASTLHAVSLSEASWVAEESRLAVLHGSGLLDGPPEVEFDRWTGAVAEETGAAAVALLLIDCEHVVVKSFASGAESAPETAEVALAEPLAEYMIARAGLAVAPHGEPAYAQAEIWVSGQLLGWLAIADESQRDWSEAHLHVLANAAVAVSTEIAFRLAKREAARVQDLVTSHSTIYELIASAVPLGEVLNELVAGIERYEPSVIPCVVLLDRESNTLHPGAGPSLPPAYFAAIDGVVIGPNVGTCGSAAWSGELTITEDIATDPKWAPIRDFVIDAGLRHCWSNPIKAADGEVLGTLAFYGPRARRPLPEHLELMRDGARLAGIAIERQRAMESLIRDARFDGLTGLPNRAAIFERLDDLGPSPRSESKRAVLFVDLDALKTLNDTLGHDRADEILHEIGERLSASVRAGEFVGRFGGDEFVVIAEGADHDQAAALAARLLDTIAKPVSGIEPTVVTASIGVALITGAATDAHEVIRQADSAMYAAKRAGRDGYSFFHGSGRVRIARRVSLARELRDAEMRGEMSLLYQPVLDLTTSAIVAVEALPRWVSPTLGLVSPAEFIPIAEDTGAIVPLGAWMVRESCETVAALTAATGRRLELEVAVTARQLARAGFAQSVHQTLAHAEFPEADLVLQTADTALMAPDAVTARTLLDLEALGIRLVLGDFGAGYASLAWLKDHPHYGIKLDRGLVAGLPGNIGDQAMIVALIGMAKALGGSVTAEGVETEAQLEALRALGCGRAQGSLLASPVPADGLAALVLAAIDAS